MCETIEPMKYFVGKDRMNLIQLFGSSGAQWERNYI